MQTITVFLAVRSPLWRAHLRAALQRAPGLRLLGEASCADQALEAVAILRPQVLLGDEEALANLVAEALPVRGPRLVLIAASPGPTAARLRRLVAGTVLLPATPEQIGAALRAIPAPRAPAATAPQRQGVRELPRLTGPSVFAAAPAAPASALARAADRRAPEPALAHLHRRLGTMQRDRECYPRDAGSGLPGAAALEEALRLVAGAGQAATIVAADVRGGAGQAPLDHDLLRRASASLRANVRPEDLICRGGPTLLVLVLPGLAGVAARGRADRLREAAAACGAPGRVSVAAAVCEVGQEPLAALARCLETLPAA